MKIRPTMFILMLLSLVIVRVAHATDDSFKQQVEDFKKEAKIIEPPDNEKGAGFPLKVKGKAPKIPEGYHVWVVVHPVNSAGYWPQGGELYPSPRDNSWEVYTYLGDKKKGIGHDYQIFLSLTDEKSHAEFITYLADAPKNGYPEKPLPSGITHIDRITYTRTE